MPISKEKFNLGHSLVSNKAPLKKSLEDIEEMLRDNPLEMEKFGLFNVGTPDFNKYYPDVKAEDLVPQDDDFAYPIFRALSAIIVNKYGPIDFSKKGVLEASMHKLVGQAVMTNHDIHTGNEVGVVTEASFQGKRSYDGVSVPGGINVKMKLDGKANPKLIRGVMMDPPSVHSVSVTVVFEWEQSHKKLDREEFFRLVGTLDDKGELIRRVVTNIVSYEEISFVPHGADPYAQRVNADGKLTNPKYADNKYNFSEEEFKEIPHHYDWKDHLTTKEHFNSLSTIPNESFNTISNNNSNIMDKEYLKFLRTTFGYDADLPEAQVIAKMKEDLPGLVDSSAEVTRLTGELETANTELTGLKEKYPEGTVILSDEDKAKLEEYEGLKGIADASLKATKDEALRLYHISCGGADKAEASIVKMIAEASFETAAALSKQYKAIVESQFTGTCKKCGSTEVTRASSADPKTGIASNADDDDGKGKQNGPKSNEDVMAHFSKNGRFTSGIHGDLETQNQN